MAIKAEARQLFTLAQMHYAETGNFAGSPTNTRFSGSTWIYTNEACESAFASANSQYAEQAVEVCKSIISKLPATMISAGKLRVGCMVSQTYNFPCNNRTQFSVQVNLEDRENAGGTWFCIGTSGQTSEVTGNGTAVNPVGYSPGCHFNP